MTEKTKRLTWGTARWGHGIWGERPPFVLRHNDYEWPIAVADRHPLTGRKISIDDILRVVSDLGRMPPGPKGGEKGVGKLACEIALDFLNNEKQRPPRGHGRIITLARMVNTELAGRGYQRQNDTVRRDISPSVRGWEKKHRK